MPMTINGSGSISGLSAGGLPDASIITADLADANVTPSKLSQTLTLGTAQNSTSGTAIDFTGIPSWVKRITVMFLNVSTNGTSPVLVRVGSGSVQTTDYSAIVSVIQAPSAVATATNTSGFITEDSGNAAFARQGSIILTKVNSTNWVAQGNVYQPGGSVRALAISGQVTLTGDLDRLRITTVNGTDTFDAGSINIMYEG